MGICQKSANFVRGGGPHQPIHRLPQIIAGQVRVALGDVRRAVAEQAGDLRPGADLEAAITMAVGAFYARYLSPEGIPKGLPDHVARGVIGNLQVPTRGARPLPDD